MSESLSVEFIREWGDFVPGEQKSLPAPMARHMIDCGVAKAIESAAVEVSPEAPVVERAVKRAGR